jgi:hypothetical protein
MSIRQDVIYDLVVHWSEGPMVDVRPLPMGRIVRQPNGALELLLVVPDGRKRHLIVVPLSGDENATGMDGEGKAVPGQVMSWGIIRLGPGVWKPVPSIHHAVIHAYLTVIDVPEPAPWLG